MRNVTNFEEATEAIVRINDIFGEVFKIHSTAGFLNTIRVERQAVIDTLAEKSFNECQEILTDLFVRKLPKEKDIMAFDYYLKLFYKRIISNTYKYEVERQLNIGDTSHIAFISLLLQGVSPIERAMLGGHTYLSSQDYYQGNSSFYADSEMTDFVSSKMHRRSISTKALKDIIFNKEKSEEAPRNLEQCIQTEDGVGYCTIDIDNDILACGDEEFCIGCKHWWCSKVQEYLENNIASSINVKIQREKVFLQKLLSKPKTKQLNGILDLDNNKLKTSINKLNRELYRRSDVEGILQVNSGLNLSDTNQDAKLFLEVEI